MENYRELSSFQDTGHERSVMLLLSLTDEKILKQTGFTDYEIDIIRNIALEKLLKKL